MKVNKSNKSNSDVMKMATEYINANPNIKKSLKVFNLSKKEYAESLQSKQAQNTKIFTNSTGN